MVEIRISKYRKYMLIILNHLVLLFNLPQIFMILIIMGLQI